MLHDAGRLGEAPDRAVLPLGPRAAARPIPRLEMIGALDQGFERVAWQLVLGISVLTRECVRGEEPHRAATAMIVSGCVCVGRMGVL